MDVMALAAAVDIVIDVVIGIVLSNIKHNDSIPTYDLLILLSNQYLIETATTPPASETSCYIIIVRGQDVSRSYLVLADTPQSCRLGR